MAAIRGRGRGRNHTPEGEAPQAHVAEEGKKVIKELVARQTSTALSLEQQHAREREFTCSSAVLPLGRDAEGVASLEAFTASAERARRREDLASAGLPPGDLQLLLEHEERVSERLSEPERLAREERLRDIRRRLTSAVTKADGDGRQYSRHVEDLMAAVAGRSEGHLDPFLRLALDSRAGGGAVEAVEAAPPFREPAAPGPEHPVHRLPALAKGMFSHLPPPPPATSRKRRRLRRAVDEPSGTKVEDAVRGAVPAGGSLWDVREPPPPQPQQQQQVPVAKHNPYGPARPKQFTVLDGRIVQLGRDATSDSSSVDSRPEGSSANSRGKGGVFVSTGKEVLLPADLRSNRLSLEEIRQLPKFAAYEAGPPSTVLYVKNLDGSVTEDDLASVFGSFRASPAEPSVTFRLCGGRMRGQAFVTFPTERDASCALEETNGYILRGRPMIVQYGRGSKTD